MKKLDPITREVIVGSLSSVLDEMDRQVLRTAMSPSFKDKNDYFVGIYSPDGCMIKAISGYSGAGMLKPVIDAYGLDDVHPGDVFFMNDPYATKGAVGHQPDMVVITPVFERDASEPALLAWTIAYGHVEDIGGSEYGSSSTTATDVYQEGVALPPTRVGTDGKFSIEFLNLMKRNSREPLILEGDLNSLLAACHNANVRIADISKKYSPQFLHETMEWMIEYFYNRALEVTRNILADGTYEAQLPVDRMHAQDIDRHIHGIMRVRDGHMIMDFTKTSDMAEGPINYIASKPGLALLLVRSLMVFDHKLEVNEGSMAVLTDVILREKSLMKPKFPGPIGLRSQSKNVASAVVSMLIAQAADGYMTAPAPLWGLCQFDFRDDVDNQLVHGETLGVGQGARPFGDGPDVIYGIAQRNYPVELVEARYPLRILRYQIATDSGGAGQYRGGCGVIREIEVLERCEVVPNVMNTEVTTPGLKGGQSGKTAKVTVVRTDGSKEHLPGIGRKAVLQRGDRIVLQTTGGGGWGDPTDRAEEDLRADIEQGFVSEAGSKLYKAVA